MLEHRPCARAHLVHGLEEQPDGARAIGILRAKARVADGLFDVDPTHVGVHLFGNDSRKRAADAGPHLGAVGEDREDSVRTQAEPEVGMPVFRSVGAGARGDGGERALRDYPRGEDESPCGEHLAQKAAAAEVADFAHRPGSSVASTGARADELTSGRACRGRMAGSGLLTNRGRPGGATGPGLGGSRSLNGRTDALVGSAAADVADPWPHRYLRPSDAACPAAARRPA